MTYGSYMLNVSFNTILNTDIYVALEQELCLPSRSEYIRLLVSRLGLPSEYDYWLREYSLNIPLKSITIIFALIKLPRIYEIPKPTYVGGGNMRKGNYQCSQGTLVIPLPRFVPRGKDIRWRNPGSRNTCPS